MRVVYLVLFSIFTFWGCKKEPAIITASGNIYNYDSGDQMGTILASQHEDRVIMTLSLFNDESGRIRAAHIHEGTCEVPLGHWNQSTTDNFCNAPNLSGTWGKPYAGDIGNISVGSDGRGSLTISSELWTLATGNYTDINGKIIAIHLMPSDFALECDPTHNPDHTHDNPKIGCGVIELD